MYFFLTKLMKYLEASLINSKFTNIRLQFYRINGTHNQI